MGSSDFVRRQPSTSHMAENITLNSSCSLVAPTNLRGPIRVLTLDGCIPGTTEFSQLLIIQQIIHSFQFCSNRAPNSADSRGIQLRPCDLFDYITGSGIGGLFAILFAFFQYTSTQVINFYLELHERLFMSPAWANKDKSASRKILQDVIEGLLPVSLLHSPLTKDSQVAGCRAFICAVNPIANASPRLFRTYLSRQLNTPCTVLDAMLLSLSEDDHLEPYLLGRPPESFSGSGHRFSNPTARTLQEIQAAESNDCSLCCIVSIGIGHPGPLSTVDATKEAIHALLRDCEHEADDFRLRTRGTGGLFFRFNVTQGLQSSTCNLGEVLAHTNAYLELIETRNALESISEQLYQRSSALSIGQAHKSTVFH
ncbi:hypothetical protein DL96DRAFT_1720219 [Flagelloscypha sp. PMI_526]|nr:hypothetical protein DL96DRAFT_1720219 [Flagelloscypha sp. PMI_526]